MNINKRARILVGALALAGSVAFAGNAYTAGGLDVSSNPTLAVVGGTGQVSVSGATLVAVEYDVNEAQNKINAVTLTFTAASAGQDAAIEFVGGAGTYTCPDPVHASTYTTTCNATSGSEASTSVTGLKITVGDLTV